MRSTKKEQRRKKHQNTTVQNILISRHTILHFLTSSGVSEWASEWTNECSGARERRVPGGASEWVNTASTWAVGRTDGRVAQYLHLDSWSFWIIEHHEEFIFLVVSVDKERRKTQTWGRQWLSKTRLFTALSINDGQRKRKDLWQLSQHIDRHWVDWHGVDSHRALLPKAKPFPPILHPFSRLSLFVVTEWWYARS